MLDGASFARASSSLACTTVAEVVGPDAAEVFYAEHNDFPPENRRRDGDMEEPEGGVSVVLIETSERESEG